MNHDHERFAALEQRMTNLEHNVSDWRSELAVNTEATTRVEENTKELLELLRIAKTGAGFFITTGRVLRKLAVWFGPFVALASFLYAISHGKLPGSHP